MIDLSDARHQQGSERVSPETGNRPKGIVSKSDITGEGKT